MRSLPLDQARGATSWKGVGCAPSAATPTAAAATAVRSVTAARDTVYTILVTSFINFCTPFLTFVEQSRMKMRARKTIPA
jgi:hypothetical protein